MFLNINDNFDSNNNWISSHHLIRLLICMKISDSGEKDYRKIIVGDLNSTENHV